MNNEYEQFINELETSYPAMFAQPYGGVAVGAGWWPIIESLCANIQSHTDWWNQNRKERPVVTQVVIEQIKEKFGGLRFYYQGGDEQIAGMVRMAEAWADRSCEECGAPGTSGNQGWIRTLCPVHRAEADARYAKRVKNEN